MISVIQVGMGGMGNRWLQTVRESGEAVFAGFVEVNPAIAAEQAAKYNLEPSTIFSSVEDALNNVRADGLINVTPPIFHEAVSVTALEAGLPVLSEKPLADTMEAAQRIVQKSNETGTLLMVAQNYRYSVPALTLKRVLESGELGAIAAVTVEFFRGPHFGGFREEMPYPLIIDMSIHHFDMMRYFLDQDPVTIAGRSWNPPWSWFNGDASASVNIDFNSGVHVSYNGSWCSQGQDTPWNGNWRFECAHGVVSLENDQVMMQMTGQPLTVIDPVEAERTAQAYLLHEFHEAITTGAVPATTCQDNIKSLAIVFETLRAFAADAPVRFLKQ